MMPALPPNTPAGKQGQVELLARLFGESEQQEHRDAARTTRGVYRAAWQAAQDQLREAGYPIDHCSPIGQMFHAGIRHAETWECRVKALEKVIREVLASEYATDEQRAALVRALHGRKSPGRDPKMLSEAEATLIAHYRAAPAEDKQMLRTLVARLGEKGRALSGRIAHWT